MTEELPVLTVSDRRAWRSWLAKNHTQVSGVWLVLAKKGTMKPTTLIYDEALEEALCHGWVDGQLRRGDEATFHRRFTPRRADSAWSKRNVALVERLIVEGRMHKAGLAVVEQAKTDGRWGSAYEGQASIEVPADLARALAAQPAARAQFASLSRANRYAVLYRVRTAKSDEIRVRRIEQFVAMLARGETIHPQPDKNPTSHQ
jgi:uncharacterized protein YdeI (YjbR/CyaY-like superfamily)